MNVFWGFELSPDIFVMWNISFTLKWTACPCFKLECLCYLVSELKALATDSWPIQNCLSAVSIDPDYVCIGHKSNYSLNIALKGQPKANRNAGITANWRHWRAVLDDRLALNEGETEVIKSQPAFVWLCAVRPPRKEVGRKWRETFRPSVARRSVIWDRSSRAQGEGQGGILTPSILWTVTNDLSRPIRCSICWIGGDTYFCVWAMGTGCVSACRVLRGAPERGEISGHGWFTSRGDRS